jgi:hypothetical protein
MTVTANVGEFKPIRGPQVENWIVCNFDRLVGACKREPLAITAKSVFANPPRPAR